MRGTPNGFPVLFVHGVNGSPSEWTTGHPALATRVAAIPGVSVWTFNYQQWSLDWVTTKEIGPNLGVAISCLAHDSGHKVIVVAHSMGGLATQFAVSQPDPRSPGHTVAGDVQEVLTFGTPYHGSLLLTAIKRGITALPGDLSIGVQALLAACADVTTVARSNGLESTPCDLPAVADYPVGTDLMYDSPAIAALPAWPSGLRVYDLAGQTEMRVGVRIYAVYVDVGDVLVTTGSATGYDTEGHSDIATCLLGIFEVVTGNNPCYHGHLMSNVILTNQVVQHIERDVVVAQPVLGRPLFPDQTGYGEVRPTIISNGGDPTGVVLAIKWHSWGGLQAVGTGVSDYVAGFETVADGVDASVTVVAFDLGTCNGTVMYEAVEWYYPEYGQQFEPRGYFNLCTRKYESSGPPLPPLSIGEWAAPRLTITAASLGSVQIGMTITQAESASGFHLYAIGDGLFEPAMSSSSPGEGSSDLFVALGQENRLSCLGVNSTNANQIVSTPAGVHPGSSLTRG